MTFYGTFRNGVIEPVEPVSLPDGTIVVCDTAVSKEIQPADPQKKRHAALLALAGIIEDGSEDGSVNVDHYLYGHPKR